VLVVSVCSLKGGVGKTSVTLGLASAALARGVPTLVVDLDPQADATTALDVRAPRDGSISEVLATGKRRAFETAVAPSHWSVDEPGLLDVLVGSPDAARFDGPRPREQALGRLASALRRMGAGYQLVLIDCPPSLGALTQTGLMASHRALVVTEPALFSVTAADRALQAIDEMRQGAAPGLQPLGVLVNRYRERSPEHRYRVSELLEMFGPLVLTPSVPERSALQQAQGASQAIHRWPGPAAAELSTIFDAHLSRVMRASTRRVQRTATTGAAPMPGDSQPAADAADPASVADSTNA